MLDVAWNRTPNHLEVGVLMADRSFRVYEINPEKRALQCMQGWGDRPVMAMTSAGAFPHGRWALGFDDGSMVLLDPSSFASQPIAVPAHQPPDADEPFIIHSLNYLETPDPAAGKLVVGFSVPHPDSTVDKPLDPTRVHVAVYDLRTQAWVDYGDVLRDEDRCTEDESDKLFEGHHRFHLANIAPLSVNAHNGRANKRDAAGWRARLHIAIVYSFVSVCCIVCSLFQCSGCVCLLQVK